MDGVGTFKVFELVNNNLIIHWQRALALIVVLLILQIAVEYIKNVAFDRKKSNNQEDLEIKKIKNKIYINKFEESYGLLRRLEMKSTPLCEEEKCLFKEARASVEHNFLHLKDGDYRIMCNVLDKLVDKSTGKRSNFNGIKNDMKKLKESYRGKC